MEASEDIRRPEQHEVVPVTDRGRLPRIPQRTTPGFVFSLADRAIKDCLGTRRFGLAEVEEVLEFFDGGPPECVFCGSRAVSRWDHLVPVTAGGETVLGNMVPACGRCDDSKQHRPYAEWMRGIGPSSLASRGVPDIEVRISKLDAYVATFDYRVRPLHDRLTEEERSRLAVVQDRLRDARTALDSLIADYRARMVQP